jgi:site-specific recombinase XerD
MNKASPHPWPELVQAFFSQRLQAQRQLSPGTINSYRDTVRLLLRYVEHQTHRPPDQQVLEDWSAPCILKFLDHLETQRGNTVRTRNLRLTALHTFMGFVAQQTPEALALASRVLAIPVKRFERRLLGCLSRQEMQALLAAPPPATPTGQRDRLLLELLYNTGARVSEIAALNRQDIQLGPARAVPLRGKGRKQRIVPLWKSTATHLTRWLAQTPGAPDAPLFTNHLGQRLSRFGIASRLRCAAAATVRRCPSLKGRVVSPHLIRHSTAMHLLEAGNDITVIALWLGHESPATTHQYLELDLALKRQCLKNLIPLKVKGQRSKPTGRLLDYLQKL